MYSKKNERNRLLLITNLSQGDHSPDNVKFPDGSLHSAC